LNLASYIKDAVLSLKSKGGYHEKGVRSIRVPDIDHIRVLRSFQFDSPEARPGHQAL
jgi:hypothetical protein